MATPSQLLQIDFSAGLDESQENELSDVMRGFEVVENVRQNGRGGLDKRFGYAPLVSTLLDGTSRTSGARLFSHNGVPCVIDGARVQSYSSTLGRWIDHGPVPEATYTRQLIPTPDARTIVRDVACAATGVVAVSSSLYSDDGQSASFVASVVGANGAILRAADQVLRSDGAVPLEARLATYGNIIFALAMYLDVGGGAVYIAGSYLDTTSPATISTGWVALGAPIATDVGGLIGAKQFDVASLSDRVVVAYANNSGGASRLTLKSVTTAGVVDSTTINTSSTTPSGISLSENSTPLWVAWFETTNARMCGLTPSNLVAVLATTATVFTVVTSGDTWIAATATNAATLYAVDTDALHSAVNGMWMRGVIQSGGATTPQGSTIQRSGVTPQGRPFVLNGKTYLPLSSRNLEEIVICDATVVAPMINFRPVVAPVQRGLFQAFTHPHMRVATASATTFYMVFAMLSETNTRAIAFVKLDFADIDRWRPASLAGRTYLGGGVLSVFDGARCFEAAFLVRPIISVSAAGAGSQTFTVGRSYVGTFEEMDSYGDWHISGVSNPVNTGAIVNKTVTITADALTMTSRISPLAQVAWGAGVRFGVWGTDDGGTTYYRVGVTTANPLRTIFVTDSLSSAQLTANALLYGTGSLPATNGSSQDHRAPPGLKNIASYNGMLVGASGPTLYFSSQPIAGEGLWFSPVFTQPTDSDVIGLATQDGALVAFASDVYIASGDPPSDNGQLGGLGVPRKLAVDFACINARSIVTTSIGTFYQSLRGIELLTRGESAVYIGEQVRQTLATYPYISAAVLDITAGLVRFSLATSQSAGLITGPGADLIFDLRPTSVSPLGFWVSRDIKRGTSNGQASQDAAVVAIGSAKAYCWLATDGTVYQQSAASYLDNGTWVAKRARTATFRPNGLQGRMIVNRALLLARTQTDSDTSIALGYDYALSLNTPQTWTAATVNTLLAAGMTATQVAHVAHNGNDCQGVVVEFTDATPTGGTVGTGRGATWLGLTVDVTPRPGAFDVPDGAM